MIKITHLVKNFGNGLPLIDINATINDGDIVSIIGPSGCGIVGIGSKNSRSAGGNGF